MNKKYTTRIIFLIITLSFFQNSLLITEFYNNNENCTNYTNENPFSRTDAQITNHNEISDDVCASADDVYFTVIIINPIDGEVINGTVIISVECKTDNLCLDEVQIFINGELKSTTKMPDYLPYPEVTYELNTTEYENGVMNITTKAFDITGNSKNFSINVVIDNTNSIWDFLPDDPKTIAIIGGAGLVGLIIIGVTFKRAKKNRVARASSKGVFRDNISKRRKGHTKKTRAKTSRAGTEYWKKTKSKSNRVAIDKATKSKTDRVGRMSHTKKTASKSSRNGTMDKGYGKITRSKTSRVGMDKVSTKKTFFAKLFRR